MKYLLLPCLLIASQLSAQVSLVNDINPGSAGSNPRFSVVANNKLVFVADDGQHGRELYTYDGISAPTLGADLWPVAAPGVDTPVGDLIDLRLGAYNDKVYFSGNNGGGKGAELYVYDGSSTPNLVADIYTGGNSSAPSNFVQCNGKLYFVASFASYGRELASFDGTTVSVIDAVPGLDGIYPDNVAVCNGKIYFSGLTWNEGREPYEYDPATNAVKRLADINTGTDNSNPVYFTASGGIVYFVAFEYQHGYELYSYNGAGVTRRTDLISQGGNGVVNVFDFNGTLFLTGCTNGTTYQLHTYDPSTNKATLVDPTNADNCLGPAKYFAFNQKLYFSAEDPAAGRELFVYDGSSISMVTDLNPGAGWSNPSSFTAFMGNLYFTADDGTNGRELYRLAGPAGVEQVSLKGQALIYPNPASKDCSLLFTPLKAGNMMLQASDAMGKLVYSTPMKHYDAVQNRIALPLGGQPTGNYFYRLVGENGATMASGKVVKQ